jgi:TolA-binding protein
MIKNWLLVLFMLGVSTLAQSQMTEELKDPKAQYERALELFDKELYVQSIEEFNKYMLYDESSLKNVDAKFYVAIAKLKLGHSDAISRIDNLLNDYPIHRKSNEVHLALAYHYLAKSKFRSAARNFKMVDIQTLDPDDRDEFTFNKSYALFKSKKYAEAAEGFKPLTSGKSKYFIKSNYYYGYALYQERRYDEALKAFDKIKNRGPETMKLYVSQIYYLKGSYKEAIDEAKSIAKPDIKKKGQLVIGKSYYKLKQYDKAVQGFERAGITADSVNDIEQYEVGYSYYRVKKYSNAFDYLSPLASKGNELAQLASYNLGHCFLAMNKKQNALNAYYEAQRKNYSVKVREESLFQYAKLSYDLDNSMNATSAFQRFLKDFPNSKHSDEAKNILASLFINTNDYKTAISIIESIENWDDNTKSLYQKISYSRGLELINARDFKGATKSLNNSLKHPMDKEKVASAYFWLGEISYRQNKMQAAITHFTNFNSQSESKKLSYYPSASYSLGYVYFKKNDYTNAVKFFNKMTALKTSYKIDGNKLNDAYLRSGDCNYMLKHYDAALDAYAYTTSAKRPESDYALFQQGMIYGLTNSPNKKINVMTRIPREYPHSIYIPDAIFELASEQMQADNYKEAIKNFYYIVEDFPLSNYKKRCYLSLGLIFYNESKDAQALVEFKNAVNQFPGTAEAANAGKFIEKIYIENGESSEYLAWLETLPNHSVSGSYKDSITYKAATKRFSKGNYALSLTDFEDYLKKFPNGFFRIEALNYAVICAFKSENLEKEIVHLKGLTSGSTNKYSEKSFWRLSEIYLKREDCENAILYLGKAEKLTRSLDKLKEAIYEQLKCYVNANDTVNALVKAKQLNSHSILSVPQEGLSKTLLAEKMFRDVELDKAYDYFKAVRGITKGEYGAKSLYYMALIRFQQDKLDDSKAHILEFGEDYAYYEFWFGNCFILLSDIYMKNEDPFQAKATLNSVIDNFSDEKIVSKAKAKLAEIEALEKENTPEEDEDIIIQNGE